MSTANDAALLGGRIALVTGAARGIGRAAAIALAEAGADVVGIDIAGPVSPILDFEPATPTELSETGARVEAAGRRWQAVTLDQRDRAALLAAASELEQRWGGLDIVFANAGIQAFRPLLEMDDPDWDDQIHVNLTGTANVLAGIRPAAGAPRRRSGRSSRRRRRGSTAPSSGRPTRPPSGA